MPRAGAHTCDPRTSLAVPGRHRARKRDKDIGHRRWLPIMSTCLSVFQERYRFPKPCNFSKAIHRNGFMNRFPRFGGSRGRKVMARSALAFLESKKHEPTFATRKSIIARELFAKR